MTNSTPNLIVWTAEYQKYLDLIEMDAVDEAVALQNDIQEGLEWVGLTWTDLEIAINQQAWVCMVVVVTIPTGLEQQPSCPLGPPMAIRLTSRSGLSFNAP